MTLSEHARIHQNRNFSLDLQTRLRQVTSERNLGFHKTLRLRSKIILHTSTCYVSTPFHPNLTLHASNFHPKPPQKNFTHGQRHSDPTATCFRRVGFCRRTLFPQIASYGVLTSNNNELPVRAFETGCWCWCCELVRVETGCWCWCWVPGSGAGAVRVVETGRWCWCRVPMLVL